LPIFSKSKKEYGFRYLPVSISSNFSDDLVICGNYLWVNLHFCVREVGFSGKEMQRQNYKFQRLSRGRRINQRRSRDGLDCRYDS
jgi:hypothetical protein